MTFTKTDWYLVRREDQCFGVYEYLRVGNKGVAWTSAVCANWFSFYMAQALADKYGCEICRVEY